MPQDDDEASVTFGALIQEDHDSDIEREAELGAIPSTYLVEPEHYDDGDEDIVLAEPVTAPPASPESPMRAAPPSPTPPVDFPARDVGLQSELALGIVGYTYDGLPIFEGENELSPRRPPRRLGRRPAWLRRPKRRKCPPLRICATTTLVNPPKRRSRHTMEDADVVLLGPGHVIQDPEPEPEAFYPARTQRGGFDGGCGDT